MDIRNFSLWFPNFATKYKFYVESGIVPQPFKDKFSRVFYNKIKREALKGKLELIEEIEEEETEKVKNKIKAKDEQLSYFYKDPGSLCEMKIKSTKMYENKVEIQIR